MVVLEMRNGQFMPGEDLKMRLFKQALPVEQPHILII